RRTTHPKVVNKKLVVGSVLGVVFLLLAWVGVTAAQVGSEASGLHDMLEGKLKSHASREDLTAALSARGFTVGNSPSFAATGP
ncbi:hypothetical protein ABTN12_19590, partial [Acinetobacter baumannii]